MSLVPKTKHHPADLTGDDARRNQPELLDNVIGTRLADLVAPATYALADASTLSTTQCSPAVTQMDSIEPGCGETEQSWGRCLC